MQQTRGITDYVGLAVGAVLLWFVYYLTTDEGYSFIADINRSEDQKPRAVLIGALLLFVLYHLYQQTKPVVITPGRVYFPLLYYQTLWWELWGAFLRFLVVFFILMFLTFPFGLAAALREPGELLDNTGTLLAWFSLVGFVSFFVAYSPVFASLLTLLDPRVRVDSTTVYSLGAREPTRVELAKLIEALSLIQSRTKSTIRAPAGWFVVDSPFPNSYTIGNSIFLTRELINSEFLVGALVHELGHLQNGDGKRLLAIRHCVISLAYFMGIDQSPDPIGVVAGGSANQLTVRSADERIVFRMLAWRARLILAFFFGGIGLITMAKQWAAYWRQQDIAADDFVIKSAFAPELTELLERFQTFDMAHPYLLSGRPYTAERIDRLKGTQGMLGSSAPVTTSLTVRPAEKPPVPFQKREEPLPKWPEEES